MRERPTRRKRRPVARSRVAMRWLAAAAVVLLALLYYRPLRTYLHARATLARRTSEIRSLRMEQGSLERRLDQSASGSDLVLQARRLGLVRPGEHLFIVTGLDAWQRAQRATIARRNG